MPPVARVRRVRSLMALFGRARVTPPERPTLQRQYLPADGVRGLERLDATVGGETRPALLEHPDLSIVFRELALPRDARLRTALGINEAAWDKPGDGARFRVVLETQAGREVLLDRYIDPKSQPGDRRWFDVDLDLSPWGGCDADLFFETDGGPAGNVDFDWAVWAAPRILDGRGRVAFDFLEHLDELAVYREVETDWVRLDEITIGDDPRPVLFQHPDSSVLFPPMTIHPGARLRFAVGVDPVAWSCEGDGVSFEVVVHEDEERESVFRDYLDPKSRADHRGWQERAVDLGAYAGRTVRLELITGAGPEGDARFDWAVWAEPRVESRGKEVVASTAARERSFLLVTVDTLRADHLGCYGSRRALTPALDALAARGMRCARAWSQSNITVPSHLAILTGQLPHRHVADNRRHRLEDGVPTLPAAFRGAGYDTFAATSVHILGPGWIEGIDRGVDAFDARDQSRRMGEWTTAVFREWLEGGDRGPFFAWVHLFDPHAPYVPTRRFHRMYYEGDERARGNGDAAHFPMPPFLEETRAWLEGVTDADFPRAQYAAQVSHADEVVGRILGLLRSVGREDDTVVALTADHGEALGEHEIYFDHFSLHEPVVRVPLILAVPGESPRTVTAPVMTLDLAPTLLELAGIDAPAERDGCSLVPLVRGEPGAGDRLIIAEHTDLAQLMIVQDGWKYLRARRDTAYTERFALRVGQESLFHLASDPAESHDRASAEPARLEALRARADALLADPPAPASRDLDMDALMKDRLRALGYL